MLMTNSVRNSPKMKLVNKPSTAVRTPNTTTAARLNANNSGDRITQRPFFFSRRIDTAMTVMRAKPPAATALPVIHVDGQLTTR